MTGDIKEWRTLSISIFSTNGVPGVDQFGANQKNWIAEAGAQGNDLITAAMPFHYLISASFRF
jgi:hypothetical protein